MHFFFFYNLAKTITLKLILRMLHLYKLDTKLLPKNLSTSSVSVKI